MDPIIEHTVKAISIIIIKPLLAGMIAFGWWPFSDFIILQVDNSVILNPFMKQLLEELRIILGVLISFAVLIRIIIGIYKFKSEKK